jgi:hypothetical protein
MSRLPLGLIVLTFEYHVYKKKRTRLVWPQKKGQSCGFLAYVLLSCVHDECFLIDMFGVCIRSFDQCTSYHRNSQVHINIWCPSLFVYAGWKFLRALSLCSGRERQELHAKGFGRQGTPRSRGTGEETSAMKDTAPLRSIFIVVCYGTMGCYFLIFYLRVLCARSHSCHHTTTRIHIHYTC